MAAEKDRDPSAVDMKPGRLEAFTDGVFAIAITLLVLNLEVESSRDLGHELLEMWPSLIAYVVSFLIIGVIWMNHHLMFHYITRVDRPLLILNLLMLMCVAFLAWPTAVLADAVHTGESEGTAAALYGGTLVVGGIFFNAIWYYASSGHRHLGRHITPEQAANIRRKFLLGPVLYLVAAAVGLFSVEISLIIYALLLTGYMFEAGAGRTRSGHQTSADSEPAGASADSEPTGAKPV